MNSMKKVFASVFLVLGSCHAPPAGAGLVWFSRANCINNESIAWDWPTGNHWLLTEGLHHRNDRFYRGWEPRLSTGWEYTYRSAAVHWGEGVFGGAWVRGDFFWWNGTGTVYLGSSAATGCNPDVFFPDWSWMAPDAPPAGAGDGRTFELVDAASLPKPPPPGELEKLRSAGRAADGIGYLEKSGDQPRRYAEHVGAARAYLRARARSGRAARVPEVFPDLAPLALSFAPADFGAARLFAVAPAGTLVRGRWTGVERFFDFPDGATAVLTEIDLAASGGKFRMLREAVNADVQGAPAVSKLIVDGAGRSVEEVIWMRGHIHTRLRLGPVRKAGAEASALALARTLRRPSR